MCVRSPRVRAAVSSITIAFSGTRLSSGLDIVTLDGRAISIGVGNSHSSIVRVRRSSVGTILSLSSISGTKRCGGIELGLSANGGEIRVISDSRDGLAIRVSSVVSEGFSVRIRFRGSVPDNCVIASDPSLGARDI